MADEQAAPADDWEAKYRDPTDAPITDPGDWEAKYRETGMDQLGAFAQTATREGLKYGGAGAGMAMGASIGALGGPFAPVTVPVGAAVGAVAGWLGGQSFADILGTKQADELPESLRPMGYAGEAFGSGMSMAGGTAALAQSGFRFVGTRVGSFLNKILDLAADKTGTFLRAETSANIGAAVGANLAEQSLPGETGPRIGAEVAGGMLSPTRVLSAAAASGWGAVRKVWNSLTTSGRETEATRVVRDLMQRYGEDPDALAVAINASGLPGTNQTTAQAYGSKVWADIEARLAKEDPDFAKTRSEYAISATQQLRDQIATLRASGDPEKLKAAADLQALAAKALLQANFEQAQRAAADAARQVKTTRMPDGTVQVDSAGDIPTLSAKATELVSGALGDARKVERELWGQIPGKTPATADNFLEAVRKLNAEKTISRQLPQEIETERAFLAGESKPKDGPERTLGYLLKLRSDMLNSAREADAAGRVRDARDFGVLAEAALNDIAASAGTVPGAEQAVVNARNFSRELNDTFTRTFGGQILAVNRTGANRIPPETMLRKAMSGGAEASDLRLSQLADATAFMSERGALASEEAASAVPAMMATQERMIRLAAADSVNALTGRVDASRLATWIARNEALLNRFPDVRRDLQAAVKSETGLAEVEAGMRGQSKLDESESAFGKLLAGDSPVQAVTKAIDGRTPVTEFEQLAKFAAAQGKDATEGFNASIWTLMLSRAQGPDGTLSFSKLKKVFETPVKPGLPTPLDLMVQNKVISPTQRAQMDVLFKEAEKIETALAGDSTKAEFFDRAGALVDLVVRVGGARAASAVSKMVPGASSAGLIVASGGSSYARSLMNTIPSNGVRKVLIQMAKDPKFLAMMLERPHTQEEGIQLGLRLHSYLVMRGIATAANSDLYE